MRANFYCEAEGQCQNSVQVNDTVHGVAQDTRVGMAYEYLSTNRAAGEATPVTDAAGTHSVAGASTLIWGVSAVIANRRHGM
jgi:hypothetical protein